MPDAEVDDGNGRHNHQAVGHGKTRNERVCDSLSCRSVEQPRGRTWYYDDPHESMLKMFTTSRILHGKWSAKVVARSVVEFQYIFNSQLGSFQLFSSCGDVKTNYLQLLKDYNNYIILSIILSYSWVGATVGGLRALWVGLCRVTCACFSTPNVAK